MKRTQLLKSLALAATVATPFATSCTGETKQPDVLFIFIDDMTFNGANVFGNHEIISPNIDKLISSGVNFTNTYIPGAWNGAVSVASRTQLMTGRYVWNTYHNEEAYKSDPESVNNTFPMLLKNAGYRTFFSGKWHDSCFKNEGIFDVKGTQRGGMPGTVPEAYNRPLSEADTTWLSWDVNRGGFWKGGTHWSEVLVDEAVDYMNANKDSEEPLFMYCAFNAVHDPRQAPKEYLDMYNVHDITVPESFLEEHPFCEEMGAGKNLRDERLAPFPRTEYSIQAHLREYYALITHTDAQIGRMLEALEKSGRADNTIIVFSADNGLSVGQHGLLGKQSMYDHSAKVPMAFIGPKIPKGESRNQLVYMQDLVPTILEYAGVESPEDMDFKSLVPAIKSAKASSGRDAIYASYELGSQRMVTDGEYKLYFIPRANHIYLFNLKEDPKEMVNLYGDPKYNEVVSKLAAEYLELAKEVGDQFDITEVYPEIFNK